MGPLIDLLVKRPLLIPRGPVRDFLLQILTSFAGRIPSLGASLGGRSAHNAERWSIKYDSEGNIAEILVNRAVESR